MDIKGSETEKNLLKAFVGESQARMRYTFFASKAKKDGFEQIAEIFEETADNEKEHAEIFFKYLEGGLVEVSGEYPAGVIGTTEKNLFEAAKGENFEWGSLYPEFERVARKEGFEDVADSFKEIAEVEQYHEMRYLKLMKNIKERRVFERGEVIKWKCRNCGYVHEGKSAPGECPACKHPQSYYEVWVENY